MSAWRIRKKDVETGVGAAAKKAKPAAGTPPPRPPPPPPSQAEKVEQDKPRQGKPRQDKLHELMTNVVKGGLWSMQQIRLLQGTVWTTWLVENTHALVKESAAAGKAYFEHVAEHQQHDRGPPHPHVALAGLEAVADAEGEAFKKAVAQLDEMGPAKIARVLLHFQVKQCHPQGKHANMSKVIVAISPIEPCEILGHSPGGPRLYSLLEAMFAKVAKERQAGSPPKNQLERTLAKMLPGIEKGLGRRQDGDEDM